MIPTRFLLGFLPFLVFCVPFWLFVDTSLHVRADCTRLNVLAAVHLRRSRVGSLRMRRWMFRVAV